MPTGWTNAHLAGVAHMPIASVVRLRKILNDSSSSKYINYDKR